MLNYLFLKHLIIQIIFLIPTFIAWEYLGLGMIEATVAMFFYKFAQKNWDGACAISDWFRGLIYLIITYTLVIDIKSNFPLGFYYITGCSLGTYIGLKIEKIVEKYILKIQTRGRRKSRWYLQGEKKQQ